MRCTNGPVPGDGRSRLARTWQHRNAPGVTSRTGEGPAGPHFPAIRRDNVAKESASCQQDIARDIAYHLHGRGYAGPEGLHPRRNAARLRVRDRFTGGRTADEPARHDHQLHQQPRSPENGPELRPEWPRIHSQDGAEPDQRPRGHHPGPGRMPTALSHRLHSPLRLPSTHHRSPPQPSRRSSPGKRWPIRPQPHRAPLQLYRQLPPTSSCPIQTTSPRRSSVLRRHRFVRKFRDRDTE